MKFGKQCHNGKTAMITLVMMILAMVSMVSVAQAAILFEEYFTGLTPSANVTTSNTDFDYVRVGSGGGSITSERTASGEDYLRLGGSTSGSLNGVGIQSSLGGADVVTLNFRLTLESTAGTLFWGMGNGTMFTGNSAFSTSQLMWGLQSNGGTLQYRTGSWNDFAPSVALTAGENYEFHIIANRSGVDVMYNSGTETVSSGNMHVYLNGALIGDVPITNNQNATGFRFYQINNGLYARLDSITLYDEAVDPFVPTAVTFSQQNTQAPAATSTILWLIAGALALTTAVFLRRRTTQ